MWIRHPSEQDHVHEKMPTAKKEKEEINWMNGLLALSKTYFEKLCDSILMLCSYFSSTLSQGEKSCEHRNIVTGRVYYGIGETQYYHYYYCEKCDEEIEPEGPEE